MFRVKDLMGADVNFFLNSLSRRGLDPAGLADGVRPARSSPRLRRNRPSQYPGISAFSRLLALVSMFALFGTSASAHHGWSSFDETKPIYLEGIVKSVKWQNPHAEFMLEVNGAAAPDALTRFAVPKQSANVDAIMILGTAKAPARKDKVWEVELAPITRMDAWKVAPIKVGEKIAVVGYTFRDGKGEAILRVEFLVGNGKVTPLRSAPTQ